MSVGSTVAAYLATLPEGLGSYPGCTVKMSVVRAFVQGHSRERVVGALPSELVPDELFEQPVTNWIPEVHANVVYLTLRDLFFAADDEFIRGAHTKNAALLDSPFYRFAAKLITPARINSFGTKLFMSMHRGIHADGGTDGSLLWWTLRFPPDLVPELIGRCYATALAAGLEAGGATNVAVLVAERSNTHIRFHVEGK